MKKYFILLFILFSISQVFSQILPYSDKHFINFAAYDRKTNALIRDGQSNSHVKIWGTDHTTYIELMLSITNTNKQIYKVLSSRKRVIEGIIIYEVEAINIADPKNIKDKFIFLLIYDNYNNINRFSIVTENSSVEIF